MTTIEIVKEAEFGGFLIQQESGGAILVSAISWKGPRQPRVVFEMGDHDWESVLAKLGKEVQKTLRIPMQSGASRNRLSQWLAH